MNFKEFWTHWRAQMGPTRRSFPIYLDFHATTPCDDRVVQKMLPFFREHFGNPGSRQYMYGRIAAKAIEEARACVARLLGAAAKEIVFTAGATESNHLALRGAAEAYADRGKHIISSKTEHSAVLEPLKRLEREGFEVSLLDVDEWGRVRINDVENAIRDDTILISLMAANNEVGTLHPLAEVGRMCKSKEILFHVDAAQALGRMNLSVNECGIDLLSLSAHKIYGPKGVGAIYVRKTNPRVRLMPQILGGGQERGLRSGTLNVPGIVGLGEACRLLTLEWKEDAERMKSLRDGLEKNLKSKLDGVCVNGHPEERLCNNLHLSFEGLKGTHLLEMVSEDLAFSVGSSCHGVTEEPSHVLKAMGLSADSALSSIRLGLGKTTTLEEILQAFEILAQAVSALRER